MYVFCWKRNKIANIDVSPHVSYMFEHFYQFLHLFRAEKRLQLEKKSFIQALSRTAHSVLLILCWNDLVCPSTQQLSSPHTSVRTKQKQSPSARCAPLQVGTLRISEPVAWLRVSCSVQTLPVSPVLHLPAGDLDMLHLYFFFSYK